MSKKNLMGMAALSIGAVLVTFLLVFVVNFAANSIGLWSYSFFQPKIENTKREVFQNTNSYVEGKRQSLTKYYQEFCRGDQNEKMAIKNLMLQDLSNFDIKLLNDVQKEWYYTMARYTYIDK